MLRKKAVWMLGLLVLLAFAVSVPADEDWIFLGEAHVDGAVDHDNIKVGVENGRFHAIQLRVSGGAIEFQRVVVHFGNGTQEDIVVRERIPSGGRTRAIELPGELRVIQSLELWYSKEPWEKRPTVRLYGSR
jgi:hypothetical protein